MDKEKADLLIINANELLTIKNASKSPKIGEELSDIGIIKNGAIAVRNGKISAVGETKKIQKIIKENNNVIDAQGKIVMPGFVDPHTHLIFAGSRENEFESRIKGATYMEILERGGGILNTVKATREASKKELIGQARKRLDKMLCYGTTTAEAKSGYGLTTKDEIKSLEVIRELNEIHQVDLIPTFLGAHAIPPEFKGNADGYIDLIITKMLPKISEKKLAEFCDVFCEKNIFSVKQSRKLLNHAKKFGLKLKIHADELSQLGGAELAAEIGAISAEHLVKASDKGLKAMAKKGVMTILLPATPFVLMEREYANARKMINGGLGISLATDLNPNSYTESMQFIITLACLQMRMKPSEAIVASTINAAHAIGKDHEIGSLEVGKKADILILDVPNYKYIPYHFGVNLVEKVIKNGRLVVDG